MTTIKVSDDYLDAVMHGVTLTMPVDDAIEYYDVIVEHLGGMDYRCTAKTNMGDKPIDYPKIEDKAEDQTVENWIANMQHREIMAGVKVYYDIWNFEDCDESYKKLFETFEREQKSRNLLTHPPVGSLRYRTDTNTSEVFTGAKWEQFSTTP